MDSGCIDRSNIGQPTLTTPHHLPQQTHSSQLILHKAQKCESQEEQDGEYVDHFKGKAYMKSVVISDTEYTYTVAANKVVHEMDPHKMEYYLASGHAKNFRFQSERLFKKAKSKEIEFYSNNAHEKAFTPMCLGIEDGCLVLENLLFGLSQPSVLDIKLGRGVDRFQNSQTKRGLQIYKSKLSSMESLSFRIAGYVTQETKEHGLLVKEEAVIKWILSKIIGEHNKALVLQFISGLMNRLEHHHRIYQATSLLVISGKEETRCKWIDFTYWVDSNEPDELLLEGLGNLRRIIQQV